MDWHCSTMPSPGSSETADPILAESRQEQRQPHASSDIATTEIDATHMEPCDGGCPLNDRATVDWRKEMALPNQQGTRPKRRSISWRPGPRCCQ